MEQKKKERFKINALYRRYDIIAITMNEIVLTADESMEETVAYSSILTFVERIWGV